MPESAEIPISPKRRAGLDRLEALHARGLWPFARMLCLWCHLPCLVLSVVLEMGWNSIFDIPYTVRDLACNVIGLAMLLCFCTGFVYRLIPWLVRMGRNNPDFTPGQTESGWITAAGFLLVFGLCLYAGYAVLRAGPISNTVMTTVAYGWIVGIVTFLWGWWRLIRARREDRYWTKRSAVDRLTLRLAHPFLLAALVALILVVISNAKSGS